jgi:hypothetical protein
MEGQRFVEGSGEWNAWRVRSEKVADDAGEIGELLKAVAPDTEEHLEMLGWLLDCHDHFPALLDHLVGPHVERSDSPAVLAFLIERVLDATESRIEELRSVACQLHGAGTSELSS